MYYIMRKSYYAMHKLLLFAKNVLRYAAIITLCVVITLCGVTNVDNMQMKMIHFYEDFDCGDFVHAVPSASMGSNVV